MTVLINARGIREDTDGGEGRGLRMLSAFMNEEKDVRPEPRSVLKLLLGFGLIVIVIISFCFTGFATHEFFGGLEFLDGTQPTAAGVFESTHWILSIVNADDGMTVTLNTEGCRLMCSDLGVEIPTWWRVWDSTSDQDGELDPGELVDSGWIPASDFIVHWNNDTIEIPLGWTGEINFQLKMERSGLDDPAGYYSTDLNVTVSEGS